MADSNIGALPQITQLDDDSLLVAEQQGRAVKVTGAQFKEFGRQAVIGQVQGYVDQAQEAAEQAAEAVSAVTGMTVEAHASQKATVAKSIRDGVVSLDFGLPRGEPGPAGPEGKQGPRGARGDPGSGLRILGYYDTLDALQAAQTAPEAGDAYGVGAEAPYHIYVLDGVTMDWKDNGQLSGGGGIVPENVVTCEGGAALEVNAALGDAPHVVTFTDEEEPPLSAGDIVYGEDSTVQEAIEELFTSVSDGKALIASAISDKGVPTAQDASFADMAEHIGQIAGGGTSDATATPGDILAGKTAYTASGKAEGLIPTLAGQTIVPGTADKTIANGQYLGGTQVIKGDPNLTSGNIKKGVSIFGVAGAVEQSFLATLTVTADTGAVVTATHTSGAQVEALSTAGSVTLELPLEGTWSVTAVRGVAQYNTVTVEVTSQYSAALTAEVHIVRYGTGTPLSVGRWNLGGASIGGYALFAGGEKNADSVYDYDDSTVDAYDQYYTRTTQTPLGAGGEVFGSVSTEEYALFRRKSGLDAFNELLTKQTVERSGLQLSAAAKIGEYALFGGPDVEAYDKNLTVCTLTALAINASDMAAASNDNYAIFAGGYANGSMSDKATAYDQYLTRSTPTVLSQARWYLSAARAGNYVVFAGGNAASDYATKTVEAYDLFLTRVAVESMSDERMYMTAATLNGFALFVGGADRSNGGISSVVNCYDPYLTETTPDNLTKARVFLAGATVGNSVLFAGGGLRISSVNREDGKDTVDIYQYV